MKNTFNASTNVAPRAPGRRFTAASAPSQDHAVEMTPVIGRTVRRGRTNHRREAYQASVCRSAHSACVADRVVERSLTRTTQRWQEAPATKLRLDAAGERARRPTEFRSPATRRRPSIFHKVTSPTTRDDLGTAVGSSPVPSPAPAADSDVPEAEAQRNQHRYGRVSNVTVSSASTPGAASRRRHATHRRSPWTTPRTTCSGRPSSHTPHRCAVATTRRGGAPSCPDWCVDRRRTQPIQLRR